MAMPKPRNSFEFFAIFTDPLLACRRLFNQKEKTINTFSSNRVETVQNPM